MDEIVLQLMLIPSSRATVRNETIIFVFAWVRGSAGLGKRVYLGVRFAYVLLPFCLSTRLMGGKMLFSFSGHANVHV